MKIVHTADWHIGKTLRGRHRTQEYREILDELKDFLSQENVDILLIAGDVFDSFTPSAISESLVYNFLHDVSRMDIATVVVAGNHDSGLRFDAISNLMAIAGVTMVGFFATESVKTRAITAKGKSKVRVVPVPFVPERAFVRPEDLASDTAARTYSREMGNILRDIAKEFTKTTLNIVVGHMLMHGASPGGGERRLYLGDNYAVYPDEIPAKIDYLALGHVHRYQQIPAPAPVYYSGSPLQLDFGECQTAKGFIFLETEPGAACVPKFVPFKSGKPLLELSGNLEEITTLLEANPDLSEAHLKITLNADITDIDAPYQIKKNYPNAVEIRRQQTAPTVDPLPKGEDWLPNLYRQYYQKQYGGNVPPEIMREFQQLYQTFSLKKSQD